MGKIVENIISDEVITKLNQVNSLVVFTGAGISSSAGIPTLTGPRCSPIWEYNFINDLLSAEKIPGKHILHLRLLDNLLEKIKITFPTLAHLSLAKIANKFTNFHIISQNFDDLHQRANSNNCLMLHGEIIKARCLNCNLLEIIETNYKTHWQTKCRCGGDWRPDLLLFDEAMSEKLWQQAENLAQSCEMLIAIGSSGQVLPGGLLPAIARRRGAFLVEINLTPTEITPHFHFTILGSSDEVVPKMF
ncbi:MAG: NAD-dependent deacetylase [bacterium]|nr:MAG: NAD-dependent deacetylase [bacterium]